MQSPDALQSPAKRQKIETKAETRPCPVCKGNLVRRTKAGGDFWGCQSYPNCRAYLDLNGNLPAPFCTDPTCNAMMVQRVNGEKHFWGCGRFPICKVSLKWNEGMQLLEQQAKARGLNYSTSFSLASSLVTSSPRGQSTGSAAPGGSPPDQKVRELKQLLQQQQKEMRELQQKHMQQIIQLHARHLRMASSSSFSSPLSHRQTTTSPQTRALHPSTSSPPFLHSTATIPRNLTTTSAFQNPTPTPAPVPAPFSSPPSTGVLHNVDFQGIDDTTSPLGQRTDVLENNTSTITTETGAYVQSHYNYHPSQSITAPGTED